jgi:hypothetical protein
VVNGCLQWQQKQRLEIKHLDEDGASAGYCLALVLTSIPEHSVNWDLVSKTVHGIIAWVAICLDVFSFGNIVGCVHVTSKTARNSKTRDRQNERYSSLATEIWRLCTMDIRNNKSIALCAQGKSM